MYDIAVIIPTLKRPSLEKTIESIRGQKGVNAQILVRYDPEVNEYISRDRAIKDVEADYIAFIDDDAYYGKDALANALKYLENQYDFVEGLTKLGINANQIAVLNPDFLGVGTAVFMRLDAYKEVGGFPYYGDKPSQGWRQDTGLLYKFLRKYGEEKYIHARDIEIVHPKPMQTQWNPYIELKFYREFKEYCDKYIVPFDDRLKGIIAHLPLLEKTAQILGEDKFNEIIFTYEKGFIDEEVYDVFENIVNKEVIK